MGRDAGDFRLSKNYNRVPLGYLQQALDNTSIEAHISFIDFGRTIGPFRLPGARSDFLTKHRRNEPKSRCRAPEGSVHLNAIAKGYSK